MRNVISKKGVYLAVAAILIAIIAAVSVAASGGNASFAELLSQPFFRPLKSAMTALVDTLESAYDYMYKFDEVQAENEALKLELAKLREDYREYTDTKEENERLRELLGFSQKRQDLKTEPVSVIAWTASSFASSFTISKGSSSGIALYDAVINEAGYLVGQVTEVTAGSSVVTSVIDTRTGIGALIYESGDTGVLQGDFELMGKEQMKLTYLGDIANINIGSTVVTSGSGGLYPKGLVIGEIVAVGAGSSGLDEYAVVQAAAEIAGSTHLYVITDFTVSE